MQFVLLEAIDLFLTATTPRQKVKAECNTSWWQSDKLDPRPLNLKHKMKYPQ